MLARLLAGLLGSGERRTHGTLTYHPLRRPPLAPFRAIVLWPFGGGPNQQWRILYHSSLPLQLCMATSPLLSNHHCHGPSNHCRIVTETPPRPCRLLSCYCQCPWQQGDQFCHIGIYIFMVPNNSFHDQKLNKSAPPLSHPLGKLHFQIFGKRLWCFYRIASSSIALETVIVREDLRSLATPHEAVDRFVLTPLLQPVIIKSIMNFIPRRAVPKILCALKI